MRKPIKTVGELIEMLKKYPPDQEICLEYECSLADVYELRIREENGKKYLSIE